MGYAVGVALALIVGLFASMVGLDKERGFYPVVLIVIAAYYVLFAAMTGSAGLIVMESLPALMFVAVAAFGFRGSLWVVVIGLAFHGVFDFAHHGIIANPGVPEWWPAFCLAFDLTAAACLGVLIRVRDASYAGA